MRGRRSPAEGLPQYPEYLVPVMVYYGGTEATEDLGARPYPCPFHGDTTPSATINTAEGWFHCMAFADCPQGNAIQIVMKKEGLEYGAALLRTEEIAREYGVSVRGPSGRRGRMAGGTRHRDGQRKVRRTWRSS